MVKYVVHMERLDLQTIQDAETQREQLNSLDLKAMWEKLDELVSPDFQQ